MGGWGRHPQTTYIPHAQPGLGNGGGRRVRQGSTSLAPHPFDSTPSQYLILTKSLHLKYTCGKRPVSNSSALYTLFYSVIYNSVVSIKLAHKYED